MASSLPSISATSPLSKVSYPSSQRHSRVCFRLSLKPKFLFSSKGLQPNSNRSVVKAQLSKVAVEETSKSNNTNNSGMLIVEEKDTKSVNEPSPVTIASETSISEFMSQVSSLVKLVDSRDIVELQLKQLDCELIIRKKEALPQPPAPAPVVMMHPSPPPASMPSHFSPSSSPPAASPSLSAASSSSPVAALPPPAAKSAKSSLPPLKCPMAGTFYRSPGPGEPPFVKVGDKVKKGQVLCIIEAMKLMNEIEADQSGTIVEILADDAKPVSIDMPLFVIEP